MPVGKCRLCLEKKDLRNSHFISASILKTLRADDLPNPNPIVLTHEMAFSTSRPITGYVLCSECEDRFNKSGEAWTLANMVRDDSFPLWDTLRQTEPLIDFDKGQRALYSGADAFGVKMEKLIYFGLSIFWRSAAYKWKGPSKLPQVDLGPYLEPLRKFLHGEAGFPKNMTIVINVWPTEPLLRIAYYPFRTKTRGYRVFQFYLPCIQFFLCVGQLIPSDLRGLCSYASPQHFITVRKDANALLKLARETLHRVRKSEELTKWLAGPDPRTA
jgi:hypothetical protein